MTKVRPPNNNKDLNVSVSEAKPTASSKRPTSFVKQNLFMSYLSADSKQISDSRKKALLKIEEILDKGNPDQAFEDVSGEYYSKEKFIVSWIGNRNGFAHEYSIDKCDSFYQSISGFACIYARRTLFSEKQIKGFQTIERALIEIGLKLCSGRKEKIYFFEKYAKPYNERLKKKKNDTI